MAGIFFFTDVNRYVNNPHHSYIHVTHASLAEFNRITTATINTLHYNLVLHITLQNPNKDFDVYYDNIVVMAYYQNQRFIMESYSHVVYYQGKNDTTRLKLSLKGQQDMDNTLGVVEEGHQENSKVEQPHHQCIHDDNGDEKNKKFRPSEYDIFVRLYLQNTAIPNPRSLIRMNWIGNSQFTCNLKRVPLITTANYNPSHSMTAECNSDFYRVFHPPGSG
ncbi:uncharacterized protein LOC133717024 [Rosa rugosa]|uniref:uncharacterized protein LOC133717024 n=1 Tax=Rosa rugosa TaxID=74645 RepID=UPI002B4069D8|nr:uncharacterized protein LOC133717024 [Rosa rugosa]